MRSVAEANAKCAIFFGCAVFWGERGLAIVVGESEAPRRIAVAIGCCEPTGLCLGEVEMDFRAFIYVSGLKGLVAKCR